MRPRANSPRRRCRRRRGVALVEFAVILPVLLLLIVGLFEVGQLVRVRQDLDAAVREGCRQAATGVHPTSVLDPSQPRYAPVKEVISTYLKRAGLNTNGLEVSIEEAGGGATVDPRTLNSDVDQAEIGRFRLVATLPYDRNGNQGNRLINLNFKVISYPTLSSRGEWFSVKDFPLTLQTLTPPIE